jgi:DNA modification methylase
MKKIISDCIPFFSSSINQDLKIELSSYRSSLKKAKVVDLTYATEISAGKNDPLYQAHSYHTKVPHKAIMPHILHLTEPGDVILDPFCGSGMTGVAVRSCDSIESLGTIGYSVKGDQIINAKGTVVSSFGARTVVLSDLSPFATFISSNYNANLDVVKFNKIANEILESLDSKLGWVYETLHQPSKKQILEAVRSESKKRSFQMGKIEHTIWSEVYICEKCDSEIILWNMMKKDSYSCLQCKKAYQKIENVKKNCKRLFEKFKDPYLGVTIERVKHVPVEIQYRWNGKKLSKSPDAYDLSLLKKIGEIRLHKKYLPLFKLPNGDETLRNVKYGITHVHHFYFDRQLVLLSEFMKLCDQVNDPVIRNRLIFLRTSAERLSSKLASIALSYYHNGGGGFINAGRKGTLYVSSVIPENSIFKNLKNRLESSQFNTSSSSKVLISTNSATDLPLPSKSVKLIYMDPPFGGNIQYSELNFLWEAWLGVFTDSPKDAVVSKKHNKSINFYEQILTQSFKECFRVLKDNGKIILVFSNTDKNIWNSILRALKAANLKVLKSGLLDKMQNSVNAYTTQSAVLRDISIVIEKGEAAREGSKSNFRTFLKGLDLEFLDHRSAYDHYLLHCIANGSEIEFSSSEFSEVIASL